MVPPHPIEIPVATAAALDRAAEMILDAKRPLVMLGAAGIAAAQHDRHRRASCGAPRIPFFTTQMGKGTVAGGTEALHGHRRAERARLRARGHRPGRPDHRHRPRHDREAAVHHGPEGPEGDPRRLHAGQCRAGLFPACRGGRRRRAQPRTAGRPRRGQAAQCRRRCCRCATASSSRIADRATEDALPPTPQRIVHDVRAGDARPTASSRSTTACTRSGSRATTAP